MSTLVAFWDRIRKDLEIIEPDKSLSHAANFLYMINGKIPDEKTSRDFDICLIIHAEHSFNASTFSARVVASTRAHIYACAGAALAALSGELHGGANTQVMNMLIEIDNIDNAERWIRSKLDANELIMGMGHAVYKTMDPVPGYSRRSLKDLQKGPEYQNGMNFRFRSKHYSGRSSRSEKERKYILMLIFIVLQYIT